MAEAALTDAPSAGAGTSTGATTAASPTASGTPATDEQILGIDQGAQAAATGGDARATEPPAQPEAESGTGDETSETKTDDKAAAETAVPQAGKGLSPEVKEFFKSHPEVRDAYYRGQELAKLFPDFKAAQAIAEFAQNYDSPEKLVEDLRGVADLNAIDRMWYSKDPAQHSQIIENLATDDPEAFTTMVEALPDVMRRVAPDAYRKENTQRFSQTLEWARQAAAKAQDQDMLAALDTVAEKVLGKAPWAPESLEEQRTRLEQERAQLAEDRQRLAQSQTERWVETTNEEVVTSFVGAVKQTVNDLVPQGFSEKARAMLVGEIYRTVDARLQADSGLVAHVKALTRGGAGDPGVQKQIVRLVTNQAKRLIPDVAREVVSAFAGSVAATTQQKQAKQAEAASRVDVTGASGMTSRGKAVPTVADLKKTGKYRQLSDEDIIEGRF